MLLHCMKNKMTENGFFFCAVYATFNDMIYEFKTFWTLFVMGELLIIIIIIISCIYIVLF